MTTTGSTPQSGQATSLWVFEQLGGPRRRLELGDHAAPHGRPRHGEVAADELRVAHDETYYSGNEIPTRHLFGTRSEPMELEGRFEDHWGGKGFAKAKTEEVKRFVADQQELLVAWDDVISVHGFIERFRPGREARGVVAWEMTILVDCDNLVGQVSALPPPRHPTDYTHVIQACLRDVDEIPRVPPTLRGDVFDLLDSFVAAFNSATASVSRIADQIDSLATAPVSLLQRFRAGLGQLRTAIIKLRTTYDNLTTDLALEGERADEMQQWYRSQASFSASAVEALRVIADADRAAVLAERGQYKALHVARAGDTWESISRQHYASAERAADIRQANGVESGQAPVPGTFYRIPV